VSPQHQIEFVDLIRDSSNGDVFSHWLNLFRPYLLKYNLPQRKGWPPDLLASSIVFFYGCSLYIMCIVGSAIHLYIPLLVDYTLLYMLVDNYIDSQTLTDDSLKQMKRVLESPEYIPVDPYVQEIREVYLHILELSPKSKQCLLKLFLSEEAGLRIQKVANHSHETYYNIAMDKGGKTFSTLISFISEELIGSIDEDQTFALGGIMQLLDDMLDIEADINNGCHTVATNWFSLYGSLDGLWEKTLDMIHGLRPPFNIWGFLYSIMLAYIPQRNPQYFSYHLQKECNGYNLLALCDGSRILVDRISDAI
jgi:hypothetical protein